MSHGTYTHKEIPGYLEPRDATNKKSIASNAFEQADYIGQGKAIWERAGISAARHPEVNAAIGRFVKSFQDASLVPLENTLYVPSNHLEDEALRRATQGNRPQPERYSTLPHTEAVLEYRHSVGGLDSRFA